MLRRMASLTAWENSQLQHIHPLLDQAIETLKEFEMKNENLRSNSGRDVGKYKVDENGS